MTNGKESSINNQHVGVNLKVQDIIMMDASCYCTSPWLLSVWHSGHKLLIDGLKLSWSLVFIVCYQVCFGVLSQRHVISFLMLLSPGMWIAIGWVHTHPLWADGTVCLPPELGPCRNHSLPGNLEVTLTSWCRDWTQGMLHILMEE